MSRSKLPQKHPKLTIIMPLLLLTLASYPARVQAQLTRLPLAPPSGRSHSNIITNTPIHLAQNFPDDGDPKGRRRGGTSRREGCPDLKRPITALGPGEETNKTSFLASTVAEYPTFWVYVPELPTNLRSGEFVLQDEQDNDVWRTPLTLPKQSGVIAISLPPNRKYALKQGLKYHWFFRVYCGEPQNKPEYFSVDAWMRRVALTPDLQLQLQTAKSRVYTAYVAHNIWYDAVTNLAELRRTNPSDRMLAQEWTNLFKAVDLEELAQAPIVQRYSPQQ